MGKRVRISNDSINSYGTRILTSGLDISQYERNPVLLYMHQRGTVIGLVKNIKKENNEVTGELEFDEATELSRQLKMQYEKGSIRMVSIGADVLELSEDKALMLPGQIAPTVSKSKLFEVSLVDIGANDDAITLRKDGKVLMLSKEEENPLLQLFKNTKKENRMELKTIALMLGLAEDATKEQIEAKVKELLSLALELTELKKEVTKLRQERENLTLSAITEAVDVAVRERRLTADKKAQFIELGKKVGLNDLKQTLAAMNPVGKISEMINPTSGVTAYAKLSDVPENELKTMRKNDPTQYAKLYKAEYGVEYNNEN